VGLCLGGGWASRNPRWVVVGWNPLGVVAWLAVLLFLLRWVLGVWLAIHWGLVAGVGGVVRLLRSGVIHGGGRDPLSWCFLCARVCFGAVGLWGQIHCLSGSLLCWGGRGSAWGRFHLCWIDPRGGRSTGVLGFPVCWMLHWCGGVVFSVCAGCWLVFLVLSGVCVWLGGCGGGVAWGCCFLAWLWVCGCFGVLGGLVFLGLVFLCLGSGGSFWCLCCKSTWCFFPGGLLVWCVVL